MEVGERHSCRLLAAYRKEVAIAISSRKQGQGVDRGPIGRSQPHPPDRDTLRARGDRSVTFQRQKDSVGQSQADPSASACLEIVQSPWSLPTSRDAATGRWQPTRLTRVARSLPYFDRSCGRRDWDGPVRPVREQEDAQGCLLMPRGILERHSIPRRRSIATGTASPSARSANR